MDRVITPRNMPPSMTAFLKALGMPKYCTAFKIVCKSPGDAIEVTFTGLAMDGEDFKVFNGEIIEETKTFRMVEVVKPTGESNGKSSA